jgi:ornithine cyclodeaminase/alanine dehydrogenase-like protein (mu-crystallin family)
VELDALARCRLFCDEWEQASKGGELSGGVTAGLVGREEVTELGAVLAGEAPGRQSEDEATAFDSTGLAIQDLAIALAAIERADELDLQAVAL